jgi:hypothetical protein
MIHGIIFLGKSPNSINVFRMQKRIIEVIMNAKTGDSCRDLFRNLKVLPMYLLFVVNNKHLSKSNHEIHSCNTRHITNLHFPISHLTVFRNGLYYSGIRVYNNLPFYIKSLSNEAKLFKPMLRRFLLSNIFYSLDEYFTCNFN